MNKKRDLLKECVVLGVFTYIREYVCTKIVQ